jgi:hypothetical protein
MKDGTQLIASAPGEDLRVPLLRNGLFLLCVLAIVEAVLFGFMAWQGKETFASLTWLPDTKSYMQLAEDLLKTGSFQPSQRTVGYPLFLLPSLFFGEYRNHYVIAVQLLLNLGLVTIFWRLLGHLGVGPKIKVLFSALFAVAGLGMAIWMISDLLGGFLFALFVYMILLKRSWTGALLGGLCTALCILVRPTFMFMVPVMPVMAYLAGKFAAQKLRPAHLGVYMAAGALALLANYAQSRVYQDTVTPPGHDPEFLVGHIRLILGKHFHQDLSEPQWRAEYQSRIAQVGGRPYDQLTRGQQERAAKELLKREVFNQPMRYAKGYAVGFLKYLFCPVEAIAQSASDYCGWPITDAWRGVLTLLWLPLWLVCLIPPRLPEHRSLYYFAMLCLLAILGLSAMYAGAGERMRFPALILMMSVGAVNVTAAGAAWARRGQIGNGVHK